MFVLLCENVAILADGVLYGVFYAEINFAHLKRKQMTESCAVVSQCFIYPFVTFLHFSLIDLFSLFYIQKRGRDQDEKPKHFFIVIYVIVINT